MKVDCCAILNKEFSMHKHKGKLMVFRIAIFELSYYHINIGYMCDTQFSEVFKEIEIPSKDKLLASNIKKKSPIIYNEKFKDVFSAFSYKYFGITCYN